jgi:hypothetical protein
MCKDRSATTELFLCEECDAELTEDVKWEIENEEAPFYWRDDED